MSETATALEHRSHVESFGVPLVSGAYSAYFFAALSEDSLLPSDRELEQIRSFAEYVALETIYRRPIGARALDPGFLGNRGHDTVVFRKGLRGDEGQGWFYWRFSWESGPWPQLGSEHCPATLVGVMDCCERAIGRPGGVSEAWARWKEEQDAFALSAACDRPGPRSRLSPLSQLSQLSRLAPA